MIRSNYGQKEKTEISTKNTEKDKLSADHFCFNCSDHDLVVPCHTGHVIYGQFNMDV